MSQLNEVVDFLSAPSSVGRPVGDLMNEAARKWPAITEFEVERAAQMAAARLQQEAERDYDEARRLAEIARRRGSPSRGD